MSSKRPSILELKLRRAVAGLSSGDLYVALEYEVEYVQHLFEKAQRVEMWKPWRNALELYYEGLEILMIALTEGTLETQAELAYAKAWEADQAVEEMNEEQALVDVA
jgi:hypothetical protein